MANGLSKIWDFSIMGLADNFWELTHVKQKRNNINNFK